MFIRNPLSTLFLIVLAAAAGFAVDRYYFQSAQKVSSKTCMLKTGMRELWAQHVLWTRQYIVSYIADLEDIKDATDRLLQNQVDIGNAVIPYYGKNAGEKLTALLKEHILLAADVVTAAKNNDQNKLKESDDRWHKNAVDIATFLSTANPHWKRADLTNMLNEHLKLTTEEAVARLKKEWKTDITKFDAVFTQAMMMSDTLTFGIKAQFPDKF